MDRYERKEAKQIARAVVRSIVGTPELKQLDVQTGLTTVPSGTGACWILNDMAGGSTAAERLGNEIRCRSLLIRGIVTNTLASTAPIVIRVIVGIDWENLGTAPTEAELLQFAGNILSPLNITSSNGRFSILRDKTYVVAGGSLGATAGPGLGSLKHLKFFLRLQHKALYASNALGATLRGTVFIFAVGSSSGGSSGGVNFTTRLRFTDA